MTLKVGQYIKILEVCPWKPYYIKILSFSDTTETKSMDGVRNMTFCDMTGNIGSFLVSNTLEDIPYIAFEIFDDEMQFLLMAS
jgi:hypothetical protein